MTNDHPNVALLRRVDLTNLAGCGDVISDEVIWHYSNPNLPEIEGEYVGLDGVSQFFQRVAQQTKGHFRVDPVSVTPVGDDLVVVRTENTVGFGGRKVAVDVVVVWRISDGKVVEVWDIVSANGREV